MASLTQWIWVWVNSGSWWWTGRPGVLQSMGRQESDRLSDWTDKIREKQSRAVLGQASASPPLTTHNSAFELFCRYWNPFRWEKLLSHKVCCPRACGPQSSWPEGWGCWLRLTSAPPTHEKSVRPLIMPPLNSCHKAHCPPTCGRLVSRALARGGPLAWQSSEASFPAAPKALRLGFYWVYAERLSFRHHGWASLISVWGRGRGHAAETVTSQRAWTWGPSGLAVSRGAMWAWTSPSPLGDPVASSVEWRPHFFPRCGRLDNWSPLFHHLWKSVYLPFTAWLCKASRKDLTMWLGPLASGVATELAWQGCVEETSVWRLWGEDPGVLANSHTPPGKEQLVSCCPSAVAPE